MDEQKPEVLVTVASIVYTGKQDRNRLAEAWVEAKGLDPDDVWLADVLGTCSTRVLVRVEPATAQTLGLRQCAEAA